MSELLGSELASIAADPTEAMLRQVVGNVVDHMVDQHRENPELLAVWRAVDGSAELRALNRQDTLDVAEAITAAVMAVRPVVDRETMMSRALIARPSPVTPSGVRSTSTSPRISYSLNIFPGSSMTGLLSLPSENPLSPRQRQRAYIRGHGSL